MNKAIRLKIGLDYHGVITAHPQYFSAFAHEALARGAEVHIITGGTKKEVAVHLKDWNIPFNKIFSIPDYYKAKGEEICLSSIESRIPDDLWYKAKAEYCSLEGINMHIDDSKEYIKWFTTPYCRYDGRSPQCITEDGHIIDFNAAPSEVLDAIEQVVGRI